MSIKLILPSLKFEQSYNDYIDEWESVNEDVVPYASARNGQSYDILLKKWAEEHTEAAFKKNSVPSTLYFLIDDNKRILGAAHCRHELNDYYLNYRGHFGGGIRPSERKKGYATVMLEMILEIYRKKNFTKVLLTCDKRNTVSAGMIIAQGGVFENETIEENRITNRYWIKL